MVKVLIAASDDFMVLDFKNRIIPPGLINKPFEVNDFKLLKIASCKAKQKSSFLKENSNSGHQY
ncbi:MAG: hypothetical protein Q8N03_03075 [Ignavibacteria bacterium]|nr:hypothetical protein [Ignavibacteria bacterium]